MCRRRPAELQIATGCCEHIPLSARRTNRKGAVAVLTAVSLVLLVVCLVFAIDVGYLCVVRTQAQACADAAALAAAWEMAGDARTTGNLDDVYSAVGQPVRLVRYHGRRPHWALVPEGGGDPLVPEEVYTGGRAIRIPRWQGWARGAKQKLDQMMAAQAA